MLRAVALVLALAGQPMDSFRWLDLIMRSQPTQAQIDEQNRLRVKREAQICSAALGELATRARALQSDYDLDRHDLKHEYELRRSLKKVRTDCGLR